MTQSRSESAVFEPVSRRNTYQLVADSIAEAISSGRLEPGSYLPGERELGSTYAVGRSSIREAIRVLESQGLLRGDGRGGYQVMGAGNLLRQAMALLVGIERVEVTELFEIRQTLEIETAGLAALRRSASDIDSLSSRLEEMAAGIGDPARYNAADLGFHRDLAVATGNRLTVRLMEAIRDSMSRVFAVAFHLPGNPELSLNEHRGIAAAVGSRDCDQARERMRRHLERVGEGVAAEGPARRLQTQPRASAS
ncbi:MAG TPA: FCD domain-containing protein [Candidatus Dormibacteraeota bacterium]